MNAAIQLRLLFLGRKAITNLDSLLGLPGGFGYKESVHSVGDLGWEDPLERERLPTPVFLPGEFHGQRSLAGCSPWGHKESNTLKLLSTHTLKVI